MINDSICAISSPAGTGAIAIVRLSGEKSFEFCSKITNNAEKFLKQEHSKIGFYEILDNKAAVIDEVMIAKYVAPASFTGENMIEIFCHGSRYIQREIVNLLIINGARLAEPGEFSKRAFLNGKIDLSQTEAIADLIAVNSKEAHRIAISQIKGGISDEMSNMRTKMIDLVALMELELDFGEEDVEFADRTTILNLIESINLKLTALIESFKYGNAVKSGVPVVIAGEPNVGKSTLLNTLLNDDRAIVSEIPGTTRDTIEEELVIDGILFRFIDTAGLRNAGDKIEEIGIKRSYDKIQKAKIVILMVDKESNQEQNQRMIKSIVNRISEDQFMILLINKCDDLPCKTETYYDKSIPVLEISARENLNIDKLKNILSDYVKSLNSNAGDVIITSARHVAVLQNAKDSLIRAKQAIEDGLSGDLVAQDIREAMYFLGELTGSISNEEVLGAIFAKFCIGK